MLNPIKASVAALVAVVIGAAAFAQVAEPDTATSTTITQTYSEADDVAIETRLRGIFAELEELSEVNIEATDGVVRLSGQAANETVAIQAAELAKRVQGTVAVQDDIERTLDVDDNLAPVLNRFETRVSSITRAWPLYLVALAAFVIVALIAHLIASLGSLWRLFAPNPFIARVLAQFVRIGGIIGGLLLALTILDAMALFGAVAGGAGLLGLAIGFAVRDTIENYIASIMLSLRQPFRAGDHVVINDLEGVVVRLTSRATILMTMDGNHLRIPNANVFKGVILNYTRNPQRRFSFKLGVDANDNPLDASQAGLDTLGELDFVLAEPAPAGVIEDVGDSNIVIEFFAWIDQRQTDFLKARSVSINAVKTVLEDRGFTLPEPIYRVKLDGIGALSISPDTSSGGPAAMPASAPAETKPSSADIPVDVAPDDHVQKQAAEERAEGAGEDLLSDQRPTE